MKSKYRIKYNYDTGDSFNTETGLVGYVEIGWNDLEVAKANLRRIEEHYTQYRELNSWSSGKNDQEILDENQDKDWFVKKMVLMVFKKGSPNQKWAVDESHLDKIKKDPTLGWVYETQKMDAENNIILYTDEGKPFQFWAPWCGYFETLNHAEIEEDKSDRKISFN